MPIHQITWQQALPIRHAVLWPDKEPDYCRVEGDDMAWHFGYFKDAQLVSVASVFPDEAGARLRKFATLNEYQGHGIGSGLLRHLIEDIRARGIDKLWCDARASAASFYQRAGMQICGDEFSKNQIPHIRLELIF